VTQSKARWWESNLNLGFAGTVVAGLVVVGLVYVFGRIAVGEWLKSAGRWLVHPVPVPLVVLVVLIGVLLVFVVGLLLRFKKPAPPPWLNYWTDNFLGIVWRWRYAEGLLVRSSITPYCPKCETRVRIVVQGYKPETTLFICDECHFNQNIHGNWQEASARIERLIEREVNRRMTLPVS